MSETTMNKKQSGSASRREKKLAYKKPHLINYGDLRTVTLAPTPVGPGETGYIGPRRLP